MELWAFAGPPASFVCGGDGRRPALERTNSRPSSRLANRRASVTLAAKKKANRKEKNDEPADTEDIVGEADTEDAAGDTVEGEDGEQQEEKVPEIFDPARVYIDPKIQKLEQEGTKLYYEALEVSVDALQEREDISNYIEKRIRRRRSRGGTPSAIEAAPKPVRWAITRIDRERRVWHVEVVWSAPPIDREEANSPVSPSEGAASSET